MAGFVRHCLLGLALVVAVGAGCGGSSSEPRSSSGDVVDLTSVDQVRSAFMDDAGKPRLVLLLSPT
jgi:hypothetical protein